MNRLLLIFLLSMVQSLLHGQPVSRLLQELDSAVAGNDYSRARELVEQIGPGVKEIKDDSLLTDFYNTAGTVYYRLNDFVKGENWFLRASEKAKSWQGTNSYPYALALFNLAGCYKEQGRYPEAEPLYLQSLPVLATAFGQSSLEYTRCFYTLGSLYIDMGKFTEAESMCAAAVNFYKTILGDTSEDYLGALGAMGVIYQGQARYDKAEQIFLSLKEYHRSRPVPPKETLQTLENNLGELYRHMGRYADAEIFLERAVTLAGNTLAAAFSCNNLGLVQKALGNYAAAEQSYKRSISIYAVLGKTNHPDYTNPVNNLGELYRTMGRLQEAVYAFEEVIELRKKLIGTAHPNYANAVNNLALVEFAIGLYPEAEKHLLECRDIYRKALGEQDRFYANCINNLASVYKAQGRLAEAEKFYQECLRLYKATYSDTTDKYAIFLGGLAGTYRQQKRYPEAIRLTLQSLDILKKRLGEYHYDYIETEYNLAETYREAGNYPEAEKHYLNAMKGYLLLIEKYFPYLGEEEKTAFYYTVANAFETFNSFVIQLRQEFPSRNMDVLFARMYDNQVALKSLLLKESTALRSAIASSDDAELKAAYRQWVQLRETILQQYRLPPEELEAKEIQLPVLELQANNLEQKMAIALKLNNATGNRSSVNWKQVQAALQEGEMAVEIIRTDYYDKGRWTDTVYYSALVIDKHSAAPQFLRLENGKKLEEEGMMRYRRALKTKTADNQSYNSFWKPLEKKLGAAKKIWFSPDGVYQQLNVYTLQDPVSQQYLLDKTDIRLLSNTREILEKSPEPAAKNAVIFSFPDYGSAPKNDTAAPTRYAGLPDFKELPGTKIESDSVQKILQDGKWMVSRFLREEATEGNMKKIQHPRVLHIATHGYFLKDVKDRTEKVFGIQTGKVLQNPLLRSGVILAGAAAIAKDSLAFSLKEDGILTAYEAVGLDLSGTDLVVLSACETGLGELMNGQGVYGLQRAFRQAGARSLIMSLWVIDDFATQELMTNFYREWLKDPSVQNKYAAFQKAQLQLKKKYPHPYYWGAFVMLGD